MLIWERAIIYCQTEQRAALVVMRSGSRLYRELILKSITYLKILQSRSLEIMYLIIILQDIYR